MNAPLTSQPSLADRWHQHTLRGNTEYQLACYVDALRLHRRALEHAVEDFPIRVSFCVDHAIARVLISHFSLADCHRALGNHSHAAECYVAAQKFLLQCNRELAPSEGVQRAIAHANLHVQQLWQEFVAAYEKEIPEACRDTYRDGEAVLADDVRSSVLH